MGSTRFIKAKNANKILKIKGIEVNECIAGIEDKNSISISVFRGYYTFEEVKDYFQNNDLSQIDMYFCIAVAPDTYETDEKAMLCDSYIGYTKELDISYDSENNWFVVTLQKETAASIKAAECKTQTLEAQASLVDLIEGGL